MHTAAVYASDSFMHPLPGRLIGAPPFGRGLNAKGVPCRCGAYLSVLASLARLAKPQQHSGWVGPTV
jgi:hypothetical protein